MTTRTEYKPGTPSWVDLGSPDLDASRRFYGQLFGWAPQIAEAPEAGGYTLFTKGGEQVAGLGPLFMPEQPPAWSTYVTTADADATAAKVTAAGGTVVVAPMDVMDAGRMGVFRDPTGAHISVWQPKEHRGAGLVNEPGSFTWNELATRDVEKAKQFYEAVFGWDAHTSKTEMGEYTEFKLDGNSIAGMMDITGRVPDAVPANWAVYFAVSDCDATVKQVKELGGSVVMEPTTIPQGRFAFLIDPQGAPFSVIATAGGS